MNARRLSIAATICVLAIATCRLADAAQPATRPLMPRIGPWVRIASNPDLGPLTSPKQQPVDFAIWQAANGTWELMSCIRQTRCGGKTRLFYRWEAASLTDADWTPKGVAMEADPDVGETRGGLQAPYVLRLDATYHLLYGDWQHICLATSADGKRFERRLNRANTSGLFTEGPETNTRDVMVLPIGDKLYAYYTAYPDGRGAVYCRTASPAEPTRWSASKVVAVGGRAGAGPFSAECPFVVEVDACYYLFRTQRYGRDQQTSVYRSPDPRDFGVDNDSRFVCTLPVAAPEIVKHDGRYYIAALTGELDGIRLAPLEWLEPGDAAVTTRPR